MYKHILVPVDLGNTGASEKAAAVARHIARRDGSRISIISVVPAWPDDLAGQPVDYQPELDAYVAALGAEGGVDIEAEIKVGGSISGRITEASEKKQADLVVMASHDPRITDYLIGSNAAHVVLHTPCSVLVVR